MAPTNLNLPTDWPQESGVPDWLGLFANASFGVEAIVAEHKAANDDYSYIMAEALADRLAEAFAEKLHQIMRKEVRRTVPVAGTVPCELKAACRWQEAMTCKVLDRCGRLQNPDRNEPSVLEL